MASFWRLIGPHKSCCSQIRHLPRGRGFRLVLLGFCLPTTISCASAASETIRAESVVQSLGADPGVDYSTLLEIGPWDDRNYCLTASDLAYLSPEERELSDPIPAFFRVELRKEMPHLRKTGPAQYPRSAVPLFQQRYGVLKNESFDNSDASRQAVNKMCDALKSNQKQPVERR